VNTTEQEKLNVYLEHVEWVKSLYVGIMNQEIDNDAAFLLRWIVNNKINPYLVFPENIAEKMNSLLGFGDVYSILNHALYDDGSIAFVKISYTYKTHLKERIVETLHSPMVILDWNYDEDDFTNLVRKIINPIINDRIIDFKVEFLDNVRDYIVEYDRVENEQQKRNDKFKKHYMTLQQLAHC